MYVTRGFVALARKGMRSFPARELRQACAFSALSKTVTTTRFGASPSMRRPFRHGRASHECFRPMYELLHTAKL